MIVLETDTGEKYVIEIDEKQFEKLWALLSRSKMPAPKIRTAAYPDAVFSEKMRALPEIKALLAIHDPEKSGAVYRSVSHEVIFYVRKLMEITPELSDFYAALMVCLAHEISHALLFKSLRAPFKSQLHNSCISLEAWGIRRWLSRPRLLPLKFMIGWAHNLKEWCADSLADKLLDTRTKELTAVFKTHKT